MLAACRFASVCHQVVHVLIMYCCCSHAKLAGQDELRELSFTSTLRALDASWWELRKELDRYLDAYDGYLRCNGKSKEMEQEGESRLCK